MRTMILITQFFLSITFIISTNALIKPRNLTNYSSKTTEYGYVLQTNTREVAWNVLVDRENVDVYSDHTGEHLLMKNGKRVTVAFKEVYTVVGESSDHRMLCLVRSNNPRRFNDIDIYQRIGWVKTDDVLISDQSILDKKTFVPKKAFLVKKMQPLNFFHDSRVKIQYRAGPAFSYQSLGELPGDGQFCYIFKLVRQRSGKKNYRIWYLLGTKDYLFFPDGKHLLGWVSEEHVVEWNTREVLTPLVSRHQPVNIYKSLPDARLAQNPIFIDRIQNLSRQKLEKFQYFLLIDYDASGVFANIGSQGPIIWGVENAVIENKEGIIQSESDGYFATAELYNYWMKNGLKEDRIRQATKNAEWIFQPGWIRIHHDEKKLVKKYYMFSSVELQQLIDTIHLFTDPDWHEIDTVISKLFSGLDREKRARMPVSDYIRLMTGVTLNSAPAFMKMKMDILRICIEENNSCLDNLIYTAERVLDYVLRVRDSQHKFQNFGQVYYWVPEEMMP